MMTRPTRLYRVEVHDGSSYAYGIRVDPNKRIPVFCGLMNADVGTRSEMMELMQTANRLCGGTLRVAPVSQ